MVKRRERFLKSISLSQQAYERIKRKIVSLELPPGTVIDENNLQTELGLGRTPIREALKRLSLEKLVVIIPRRGMFVTDIGIADLQQIFEVRVPMEGLAARLAARRGAEKDWGEMERVLADITQDAADNESHINADEACHLIIYNAAGNTFLKDILVTHYALSLRLWYYFLPKIGDMRREVMEHQLILEALTAGNEDKSACLIEGHVHNFQKKIQSVILDLPLGESLVQIPGGGR
jgi:DNA-binding GntR family transcriptional regulator